MTAAHSPAPEDLMAYLDGELEAAASRDVLSHLATCESCQRLADDMRQASRDMRAWQVDEAPASLQLPHVASRVTGLAPFRFWRVARTRGFALAATVVVVGLALAVISRTRQPQGLSADAMVARQSGRDMPDTTDTSPAPPMEVRRGDGGGGGGGRRRQTGVESEQPKAGPSIVRTVRLRIVASNFDVVRPAIDRTLLDVGGFVGQLGASDPGDAARSINGTLRVPAARLDDAVAALKKLGRVINESQQADDVTEQVVDLDVRIANARITEKRLTELIQNRTGRVSDVLEVEREMARVRTELERLDAQRKNVERRVAYATLILEVLEERRASVNPGAAPVPTRLRHAVADGFESALSSVLAVSLFLLRAGPSIVLWAAVIGVPGWWIFRRSRRKSLIPHP
jgi:anti-sigma factor RsiW